jgi:DNA-directed RNA polymerase specialized sigma24 family protein
MTEGQRMVFCGIYYHRKTTAALANELNLPEQELRLRLKEAFMIIRQVKDEN